jgi:hypothetical protein
MPTLTPESADTRILPKYTLYIGPKSAPKTGNEPSGKVGVVLLLGPCTTNQISSQELGEFLDEIKAALTKGHWVRLSSSSYQPYCRYRWLVRSVFRKATFFERITLGEVSRAPGRK